MNGNRFIEPGRTFMYRSVYADHAPLVSERSVAEGIRRTGVGPGGMMKHYEELTGGSGRRIYYRAERFKARDLFKRALPDLAIDNIDYALQDISLNGLAALAGRGTNNYSDVGVRVPVQLGVNGTVLHAGVGEISRIEPTPFGTKLGVRLTDRCFNIPQLVAKYQETLIRADL